jgi:hypothetical protein
MHSSYLPSARSDPPRGSSYLLSSRSDSPVGRSNLLAERSVWAAVSPLLPSLRSVGRFDGLIGGLGALGWNDLNRKVAFGALGR